MKRLLLLLTLFFVSETLQAQFVTIPDANFVNFLTLNYPACMNGNQMDTTCSAITSAINVNCSNKNISNLDGIQYFDNLVYLRCNNNPINQLLGLPASTQLLDISFTNLPTLPQLPSTLYTLIISFTGINGPIQLPSQLHEFYCSNTGIIALPTLPPDLFYLDCSHNAINALPALPPRLRTLLCNVNQINSLPSLPDTLEILDCSQNYIANLPVLPNTLTFLDCSANGINSITALPPNLSTFYCAYNFLTSLPTLPSTLTDLICLNNSIQSLPLLPQYLYSIVCSNNQLTSLPELPEVMSALVLDQNPNLSCLPQLKTINGLSFTSTSIQCLPNIGNVTNSNPPLNTLPLCDLFNNNGCGIYWNITGNCYLDTNNNCISDASENRLSNIKIQLYSGTSIIQQTYSGNGGLYSFDTNLGNFYYHPDITGMPLNVNCPPGGVNTSVLTSIDSIDTGKNFGFNCKFGFDVGASGITRIAGSFFPGQSATINLMAGDISSQFGLQCAAGISGTVVVSFSGPISFVSTQAGALTPFVNGNTLTYTISDFGNLNYYSDFSFIVSTATTAQAGDTICFSVNVSPTIGDNDVSNNNLSHCFLVVNSFDPNEKEVSPVGNISATVQPLTYTIHFQNTGNAPAQHIYIIDTLDVNLNYTSFRLLGYSHQPLTQIVNNVVRFNFPNINLPDSTNDEPNSHGYVTYQIKNKPGLTNGTIIKNTASIFFDFNPPVVTNTVENVIDVALSTNDYIVSDIISISPNPTYNEINVLINSKESAFCKIEIMDVSGRIVTAENVFNIQSGANHINYSSEDLTKGIYFLKITIANNVIVRKIVKL